MGPLGVLLRRESIVGGSSAVLRARLAERQNGDREPREGAHEAREYYGSVTPLHRLILMCG
jgi:hypothetical protein